MTAAITRRPLRKLAAVVAVAGLVGSAILPLRAEAALLVCPGLASDAASAIHGTAVIAVPPPSPSDFFDRGRSMDTPGASESQAAWEAHFNSPVVDGPELDDNCEIDD